MKPTILLILMFLGAVRIGFGQFNETAPKVKSSNGILEGIYQSGISEFKGIPYAEPPVGDLRWKAPEPVKDWTGIRKAVKFGPRAMQLPVFGDMNFRSNGMSEDCLYLNVWTPAKTGKEMLPVLVYFFGGGYIAGDGSEPRYDGESMARRGIITVTVNYRLGIFGFLSYPGLDRESMHHSSGNYGLLDQVAALKWVKKNIKAFGGDPNRITIAGESAGSFSVSGLVASPLSRNLIEGAIGESGSLLGLHPMATREEAENAGLKFAKSIHKNSLKDLREMSAEDLLKATSGAGYGSFPVDVDGYFFPESPEKIFEEGKEAHVPSLIGWNSEEMNYHFLMGKDSATVDNFNKVLQRIFKDKAPMAMKVYHPEDNSQVVSVGNALASDLFIAYSTWKWSDLQSKTGGKPVFRYFFERARPVMRAEMGNATAGLAGGVVRDTSKKLRTIATPPATGAVHSAEIEYAMGNLSTNRVYDWQPDDYEVSAIMESFFANFIKTGNPNGLGVPHWPAVDNHKAVEVMHINVFSKAEAESHHARYLFLANQIKK